MLIELKYYERSYLSTGKIKALRMFKTYLDSVKAKLSDLFYLHGKVCATHPLVVLSLVFTINNTCSAPAIWAFFFNPSSIDRFLDFGGSAVPAKAGIVFSPTSNVIGIDQIIIETSLHDALKSVDVLDPGSLNIPSLKVAHHIQQALNRAQINLEDGRKITIHDLCFKLPPGNECLFYSPLEFWNNDIQQLEQDTSLTKTVSKWVVNSSMGFIIPAWSVFGGIQGQDSNSFYGAGSLRLTYFLKRTLQSSDEEVHSLWNRLWNEVTNDLIGKLSEQAELSLVSNSESPNQPKLTLLEFSFPRFRFSTEVILLSVGYLGAVIYMFVCMSRFKLVKSKFWLGFAAVLIFNLSLLMAFGICLFFDLEIAFIPWKVVPFFIIAIGSENVLRITQAVASTSLDLPVRERIGEGVRNCCIRVTCHLGVELSILGVSYYSSNPTLSEFGLFGAIAVLIDYLLQMTFFVAVLSIDTRRLELSDLQELKDPNLIAKKIRAAPQDADQSLFLASIWESMLDQIGKLKSYSSFKFTMVGLSLFSAVFISKQLRQTAVFSYSQGLELSGMEFPYTSQLDDKFWKLLNPSSNELYLEIRPAKRLTLTWLPSKDVIAGLSQPFKTFLPHKKVVQKPTLQTLLLLLATGGCITIYLNILSKGRRNEKARWQNLDPRKSICVFKGFWADVVILESNGQELVAALSLAGELVVWNHHINRVIWQGSKDGSNLRISSLAVSTHGWLVCGYLNGSVDFFCFEPSYRGSEPSTLLFQGESAAPVSRILFLPQNQNLIAILAGGQLFIYHLIQQKVIYSSNISSKVACVYGLPQIVFAGLATGEVLVISLNEEEDRTQLSTDAISTASSLPITYLDALETDGRFRVLLIGFQNSDCEVQLLSDTNDLKRHLLLPSLDTGVKAIIGLQLLTSPDGFIATISSPTTSYIIHLSQHNIISPTSPRNLSFKITYSATVPSVGCPFTFTQGETLIGLSRVSRHWELWGIRLSHGSLQGAIQNRLRFSLACDPLANEGSDLPEDSNSDKSYPWVPFGFVSLPFVPLSKSQGLGMALGNYVFCINPHLLLSSQDD